MIFRFDPALSAAFSALYALMETALLALFLQPYARQGCARVTGAARAGVLALYLLAVAACVRAQTTMNMALNLVLLAAVTMLAVAALCRTAPGKAVFDALIFQMSTDLAKTLVLDMLPPLTRLKESGSPAQMLLLVALAGAVQCAALLVLRGGVCRPRQERLTPWQTAQVFFPALPYLYVKLVQYKSFALRDVVITQETGAMSFALCLLALVVAAMGEQSIAQTQARERAAREQLALERQQEEMREHLRRIEETNRLSHDMRNHLSTIAAMSGRREVQDYVEALLPTLRPVTVTPFTGVEALDVLISRKADACAQLGGGLIPCVSADAAQALARLSAPDLCTIFGNLLDNAVEAVAAVPDRGLRDVTLRINRRDGFLLIRTENRFEGERDASLASTKPNAQAHGYGMKNLRDAVERLGGEMTAGAQERQFIVNILLPAGK